MSQPAQIHERENRSLSAAAEKRALIWMAMRMPHWVSSDHLTALGFGGMLFAGLSYWAASYDRLALLLVVVGLTINWFGDSLDGTLARVRGKLRPRYGFYVDHVVDIFGTLSLLGGLAFSGFMSPAVAMGLLLAFVVLNAHVYLATHVMGTFRMSFWKFGPTELRILLAIGTLMLLIRPEVQLLGRKFLLFDVGGAVAIVGMSMVVLYSVVWNTIILYRAETLQ